MLPLCRLLFYYNNHKLLRLGQELPFFKPNPKGRPLYSKQFLCVARHHHNMLLKENFWILTVYTLSALCICYAPHWNRIRTDLDGGKAGARIWKLSICLYPFSRLSPCQHPCQWEQQNGVCAKRQNRSTRSKTARRSWNEYRMVRGIVQPSQDHATKATEGLLTIESGLNESCQALYSKSASKFIKNASNSSKISFDLMQVTRKMHYLSSFSRR